LIESAHDSAEGGLAVTLAESCFGSGFGVAADIAIVGDVPAAFHVNATLFGESASCVVVSARESALGALLDLARDAGVPARVIGRVGGSRVRIAVAGHEAIDVSVADAEQRWATAVEAKMGR
jgi:phosphoribosylformylglycinamidine synthase